MYMQVDSRECVTSAIADLVCMADGADGCLILQAGKQMEWLTGGHVQAGMHEVI